MDKLCVQCREPYRCAEEDLLFYDKISPEFGEKRFPIPPPERCPNCRLQNRIAYRNEYHYYSRNCDLCQKSIIAIYSPSNPQPVYCYNCFWGDRWDASTYG